MCDFKQSICQPNIWINALCSLVWIGVSWLLISKSVDTDVAFESVIVYPVDIYDYDNVLLKKI